jgi:hypothetical protein
MSEWKFLTIPEYENVSDAESQKRRSEVDNELRVLISASPCSEKSQRETRDREGDL